MPKRSIAIIGGGVAGLSAAVTLANANTNVTVFETNSQLGGRAKGIQYQGLTLDNGQHILLGAYRETLRLLALTHAPLHETIQRLPLTLTVFDIANQSRFALKAPAYLPAPLHILAGLLSARGITPSDKWYALRMMAWMKWHAFKLPQDEAAHILGASTPNQSTQPIIVGALMLSCFEYAITTSQRTSILKCTA